MTTRLYAATGPITGHVGIALWLQHEIEIARGQHHIKGRVDVEQWALIDQLTEALIEAMPTDPPRRR